MLPRRYKRECGILLAKAIAIKVYCRKDTMKTLLAAAALLMFVQSAQAAGGCTYCTSSLPGFYRGPGRVIYPGTPPSFPPPPGHVLAPGPEMSGDYSIRYLYSHTTQQAYADPMYYEAQSAVARWNSRSVVTRKAVTASKRYQTEK